MYICVCMGTSEIDTQYAVITSTQVKLFSVYLQQSRPNSSTQEHCCSLSSLCTSDKLEHLEGIPLESLLHT